MCTGLRCVSVTGRERPPSTNYSGDLEELEATHRGCHKFIPRHPDELFIEIGDPIYVEVESDDLWCEGVIYLSIQKCFTL